MQRKKGNTVYSTDVGDLRKQMKQAKPASHSLPPNQQEAHIRREKSGRGGKEVTVIMNLQLSPKDAKALGKKLKKACGSGGTVKETTIEIQGDHRQKVQEVLKKLGYGTKFVGG